jgi:hypothetical protein
VFVPRSPVTAIMTARAGSLTTISMCPSPSSGYAWRTTLPVTSLSAPVLSTESTAASNAQSAHRAFGRRCDSCSGRCGEPSRHKANEQRVAPGWGRAVRPQPSTRSDGGGCVVDDLPVCVRVLQLMCRAGSVFAAEEGGELLDGAHERCWEDDGGVLVDAQLDQ